MKSIVIAILIFCGFPIVGESQQFIVKSFDNSNGLISASNNCTYQDSSNFYWISSYGGLVRFDGSTFKSFRNADGIHDYLVNSIYEKRKNEFIVCNQFSLLKFDGIHFKPIHTNVSKQYQFERIIRLSNGTELMQTNLGVLKFENDSILNPYTLATNANISMVHEYLNQKLIVYYNQEHKIEFYKQGKLLQQQFISKELNITSLSSIDTFPILNTTKGVYSLNKSEWVPFLPKGFSEPGYIKSVFQDSKYRIWFTDGNDNLWVKNGSEFYNLSKRHTTKSVIEPSFIEDKDGNIVVTSVYGLLIFRESGVNEIQIEEINNTENNYTLNLISNDTIIVAISPKGFIGFSKGKKIIIPIGASNNPCKQGIARCDFFPIENTNEFIVRISNEGIFLFNEKRLTPYCKLQFNTNKLFKGYYDKQHGCYYAGSLNTLYRITENSIDTFDVSSIAKGLPVNSIHKLSNDVILFSLGHERLLSFYNNKIVDITSQLKTQGKTFSAEQHGNSLWIIVHGVELQEYQWINSKLVWKRTFGKDQGLVDANIAKINFDEVNDMWLNCFSGIYLLKLSNSEDQITCKKITLDLGNSNAPMINDVLYYKNHLYALGIGSIIDIDKNKVQVEIKPSSTYFSSIEINSIDMNKLLEHHSISYNENVYTFPTKFNSFSFQCNSIYWGFDDGIQYEYKLEGGSGDWKKLNSTNSIQYTNLSSGHYILYVRCLNKLTHKSYSSTKFEFVIEPPFWQTWWFRSMLAMLAIGSIYLLIKRRDSIREKETKLNMQMSELKLTALQSQMNPHFIFNSLNAIQNYIMQQKPIDAARYLSKFSKLMRRILDQSFNNVSPLQEIIETINMYLELEAFRFNNEFEWKVMTDDNIKNEEIKLPPMIIQPFVENAIIHGLMPKSGAKLLLIKFYVENKNLYCVIDDNGVGRSLKNQAEKTHISRGQKLTTDMLATMKEMFNKDVSIEYIDKKDDDQNSLGTTVQIIIPQ